MEETPKHAWISAWPVVLVLIINIASLAYIASIVRPPVTSNKDDQILAELAAITKKLEATPTPSAALVAPVLGTSQDYTPGSVADLLSDAPATPTSSSTNQPASGYITPLGQTPVDVYKENATFSPVIDKLTFGQKYPFSIKLNNWYLVNLANNKTGWVEAFLVETISANP